MSRKVEQTFTITYDEETGEPTAITCLICGRTSYNKNDIEYEYCGNCHQYHEFLALGQ
jgi:transcription elongation factor Elf1